MRTLILIGGIVSIPLVFSCATGGSSGAILLKKATAERAVVAAKTAMAEYSKCPSAVKNYFDAESFLKQGQGYMTNQYEWDSAEKHFDQAIKFAEQAEEEATLCDKK